MGLDSY